MWLKIFNIEVILIYFLLLTPWPDTHVIKLFCSSDSSRLVRKIVRSKWTSILDKYQVKLPLECPLHPFRDLFAPREDAKKRDRPTQWTCRECGKSFYQEKFLDLHFETRHKSILNHDEDAVCLADLCDILRCEVFQSEESRGLSSGDTHVVTDVEVWGDSLGQNSALAIANAAYLSLLPLRTSTGGTAKGAKMQQNRQLCQDKKGQTKNRETQRATSDDDAAVSSERPEIATDSPKYHFSVQGNAGSASKASKASTKVNQSEEKCKRESSNCSSASATPPANETQGGGAQSVQKARPHCRPEELSRRRSKCEHLVRSCIASALLGMTDQAFLEMEAEMNKAVCSYLTCERYWEDGPLEPRAFPWGLFLILAFALSAGICFCYYIIWILFDSEETTIHANYPSHMQHQQPHYQQHAILHGSSTPQHYYYPEQQPQPQPQPQHDLYPEQTRYEYRHSPRRYTDRTHQATPTAAGHQVAPNLVGPTDLYDRRDYISRATTTTPIATTAVGLAAAGGGQQTTAASEEAGASLDSGTRHYNPHQRHPSLEPHHRHIGASQTSLRGSASAHEIIQSEVGQNEQYIYVTYPPDLKKRFFEKYE